MSAAPLFTTQDIEEILRLVDHLSDIEIRLESGDLTFHVWKSSARNSLAPTKPPSSVSSMETTAEAPVWRPQDTRRAVEPERAKSEAGTAVIRASMPGTFYRAPFSADPPFVDIGTQVGAEDPVCLIEVMKLFTTVKAGVSGRIVSIEAKNGVMVEEGDALFVVQAD